MNGLIQSAKHLEKLRVQAEKIKKEDERFMKEALKQAKKALEAGEVPVGAVIVKEGKIIARGYNQKEKCDCALYHAETVAIKKASAKLGWRLEDCDMYVTLEPCAMCAGAIASARIRRLIFGSCEPKSGFCVSRGNLLCDNGLNNKTAVVGGILQEECSALITEFFSSRRPRRV